MARLPGHKVLSKGNHDLWWSSLSKLQKLNLPDVYWLQNNSHRFDGVCIAGTRGWALPGTEFCRTEEDHTIYKREVERLKLSLESLPKEGRRIGMLHYPPLLKDIRDTGFTELFEAFGVDRVVYGHLHLGHLARAFEGVHNGVTYHLVSCDVMGLRAGRDLARSYGLCGWELWWAAALLPGINGVIGACTIEAVNRGFEVFGILDGFQWLMRRDVTQVQRLNISDVSRIHFAGGSILRTSRANPTKDPQLLQNVVDSLHTLGITHLVAIGGDDTAFTSRSVYEKSGKSIKVAHVPKTIDNDLPVPGGHSTFGYQTARHLGTEIVQTIMTDAKTTLRWYIIVAMAPGGPISRSASALPPARRSASFLKSWSGRCRWITSPTFLKGPSSSGAPWAGITAWRFSRRGLRSFWIRSPSPTSPASNGTITATCGWPSWTSGIS